MKILITYSTDYYGEKTRVEKISTLKQLIELYKKEGLPLIFQNSYKSDQIEGLENCEYNLEVYDGWRE